MPPTRKQTRQMFQKLTGPGAHQISPISATPRVVRIPHPRQRRFFLGLQCDGSAVTAALPARQDTRRCDLWLAEGIDIPTYSANVLSPDVCADRQVPRFAVTKSTELYRPWAGKYKAGDIKGVFPVALTIEVRAILRNEGQRCELPGTGWPSRGLDRADAVFGAPVNLSDEPVSAARTGIPIRKGLGRQQYRAAPSHLPGSKRGSAPRRPEKAIQKLGAFDSQYRAMVFLADRRRGRL